MIFSVIMLGFLWIFQIAFLESSYTHLKQNQVTSCANTITSKLIKNQLTVYDVDEISKNNEMSVYLFDSSDAILIQRYASEFNNPVGKFDVEMSRIYNYYKLAFENNGVYSQEEAPDSFKDIYFKSKFNNLKDKELNISSPNRAKNLVYAEIINVDSDTECFVVVTAMITPVETVVDTLRSQLIFVSIIFISFAIILAIIVANHISKPIVSLNTSIKELAHQNYNVEFSASGYQEVNELSSTLNFTRDELVKVDKLRHELIANISHDLRTPLTMITGYAEVMRDLPGENTSENLQVIIDEAKHLSDLVSDMLDLSKLQAGVMTLQYEEFSLTELVEEIFNRYVKLIQQDNYDIHFVADKNVTVYADKIKIGQVIYNFINNAVNHCGTDKEVIVTQKIYGKKVRLEVTDHGEGISQDKLQYIWDRYYKVDKNHKRGVIGTGLGLSIVKKILDMHRSQYGVESQENLGSTFWFELTPKSIESYTASLE